MDRESLDAVSAVTENENIVLDKQYDHIQVRFREYNKLTNQALRDAAVELDDMMRTATTNVDYDMEAYAKTTIDFYEKYINDLSSGLGV